ncbi:hypothetical protein CFP56_032683, partial [Quercus suber]
LPYEHFQCWTSMKVANLTFDKDNAYMNADTTTPSPYFVIMMEYGSGLIIGFVTGNNLTIRKLERFLKNFGRKQ